MHHYNRFAKEILLTCPNFRVRKKSARIYIVYITVCTGTINTLIGLTSIYWMVPVCYALPCQDTADKNLCSPGTYMLFGDRDVKCTQYCQL